MVLRENVYGWYPPAKSIWTKPTKPGIPVGYDADSLYKHWKSRYNGDQRGVATPAPPIDICTPSARSSLKSTSRASVKVPKFPTPSPAYLEAARGATPGKASPGRQSPGRVTPVRVSSGRETPGRFSPGRETPIRVSPGRVTSVIENEAIARGSPGRATPAFENEAVVRSVGTPPAKPTKAWDMKVNATPINVTIPKTAVSAVVIEDGGKKERTHSAPLTRQQTAKVSLRQIKSAGPSRATPEITNEPIITPEVLDESWAAPEVDSPIATPQLQREVEETDLTMVIPDHMTILDYHNELQKHGWKMEIPGDPFGYKAPCIKPRLSYTKKSEIPTVAPKPPRGHMEVYDTYFYNTIPRKPLSFTVHPEWVSEVLLAKRITMQKRTGIKYKQTDYSFAY